MSVFSGQRGRFKERPLVMVIDDEESIRDSCCQILKKDGFQCADADEGIAGIKKAEELRPDLILIDLKMPGINGLEVLDKVIEIDPDVIPVVITGYATIESAVEAMKKGAYDYLPKPFTPEELRVIIRRGTEKRKLKQEAEALRKAKKLMEENFITMVTHQLRSPLVAIQQYFEVILAGLAGKVDKKQKGMLLRARMRIEDLMNVINDWLDVARMDSGQIVDKLKPTHLKKLIIKISEDLKPLTRKNNISLEFGPFAGSDLVQGDKESLEQVFYNLITNAIIYNKPNGKIVVSIKGCKDFVAAEIQDTGIGIAEEHIPFLFDQFYRVNRKEDQKIKGTGLGLSIAKKVVDAHEGTIEVSSEPGKGSTFTVFLRKAENSS